MHISINRSGVGAEKVNRPQGEVVATMVPDDERTSRRLESTLTFLYLRAKNRDFFSNKELILLNGKMDV